MKLDFSSFLKGMWCRGIESNCRHQPFQDMIALCNELKQLVFFCRGERGQPNGQPVSVHVLVSYWALWSARCAESRFRSRALMIFQP